MKNLKIRRLWVLVAFCLIGINTFQGYWLWQQYRAQQQNFSIAINGALSQAAQEVKLGEAAQLLPILDSIRFISIETNSRIQIKTKNISDSMMVFMPSWLGQDRNLEDEIHQIDSIFGLELLKRGIVEPYHLDTVSNVGGHPFTKSIVVNKMKQGINMRSEDKVMFVMENKAEPDTGAFLQALAPLGFQKHLFLRASFPRHNYHVLAGIAGTLLASLLLALLTAGAFFYLLYIIQHQKKLAALKSDFINAMTHELQTPIATASAAIEALQHFNALENPLRTQDYLEISQAQLTQLSGMVDQTLRLASEERDGFDIRKQAVDLDVLIPPLLQRAQLATGRNAVLSFENQLKSPVPIDAEHFSWAVQNLIDNAIKYCPTDRIPQVQIRAYWKSETHWELTISDNGVGIAEAYRGRLFERFYRVPSVTNVKGFGLGLYVAQRIVEGHGGQLRLSESSDSGSVFLIALGSHSTTY